MEALSARRCQLFMLQISVSMFYFITAASLNLLFGIRLLTRIIQHAAFRLHF